MARIISKTANVYTRVDPDTKEQAETILNYLGIPMSNAIGMFLRQVVIQRGMPFEMKLPSKKPVAIDDMTKNRLTQNCSLAWTILLQAGLFQQMKLRLRYGECTANENILLF